MSRRTERLSSLIREELASVILHELDDPRLTGMPSITRVKVSDDISMADVYITSMGTPGQQSAALNALRHSAGVMRTRLTKALSTRIVPYLRFHIDEQLKKELDILNLLDKVHQEHEELDRKRSGAIAEPAGEADVDDAGPKEEEQGLTEGRTAADQTTRDEGPL